MILDDVRAGLSRFPKKLPAYLFYDAIGSGLYERITSLPEYYLTADRLFAVHLARVSEGQAARRANGVAA